MVKSGLVLLSSMTNPYQTGGASSAEETSQKEDKLSMLTTQFSRKSVTNEIQVSHKAFLEIHGLGKKPVGFELSDSEIEIGRKSSCQLSLPLFGVSRVHARIFFHNEEYYLEDLNSTNGTYVNTIEIVKCVLRNNDQIEVGEAKIIFIEEKTRREPY